MSTPPVTPDPRIVWRPASELRDRFIEFFAERNHTVVPSASLVPAGDQTLLFTNSGMVQFKDVLTGKETRSYTRAVDYQRSLRVAGKHNDFEEVGGRRVTTRSSRCSATGASATTSSARRSTGRGTS